MDLAGDIISIIIGEGDSSEVVRLSAGSEATGADWCSGLKAQAHNLSDEEDE